MKKDYIICSPEELPDRKTKWYVFLAGPIQGAPQWQFEVPNIPGVLYLSPRREDYTGFDYAEQFKWETIGLLISDVVLFWIPPEIESVAGRSYAQTTRTEFGEYLARGKKIITFYIVRNNNTDTLMFSARNNISSAVTNATATFTVLYMEDTE